MSETEGAPSKRAMEIARTMQFASETEIASLLDAEFRKGEELAKTVKPIIDFVEFLLDRETCMQDYPTDKCREVIAALAAYRSQP